MHEREEEREICAKENRPTKLRSFQISRRHELPVSELSINLHCKAMNADAEKFKAAGKARHANRMRVRDQGTSTDSTGKGP